MLHLSPWSISTPVPVQQKDGPCSDPLGTVVSTDSIPLTHWPHTLLNCWLSPSCQLRVTKGSFSMIKWSVLWWDIKFSKFSHGWGESSIPCGFLFLVPQTHAHIYCCDEQAAQNFLIKNLAKFLKKILQQFSHKWAFASKAGLRRGVLSSFPYTFMSYKF